MTSSLVGSEMCIRDRNRLEGSQQRRHPATAGCTWTGPPRRRQPTTPVSYTHLTLPTICSV
eukprot:3178449-Prorocentrum_lima.AAC.1